MRVIGLDIHRVFAEAVMLEDGTVRRLGRVGMTRDHLATFARTLTHDDHVVVEATGNASAVAEVIRPHVGRVVVANPRQVRLIAEARIKTDVIDATVLARLYASGFLPEIWIPDETTLGLRRQVTQRTQIVRQRTRLKTIVQSILHAHLVPPCPHADLFYTALDANTIDRITDFAVIDDRTGLSGRVFTAAGPVGRLPADAFLRRWPFWGWRPTSRISCSIRR